MSVESLPEWAAVQIPIGMDDAAMVLGVSRRYLVDVLRNHPHFERRGVKKVFYPEHIAGLREALREQSAMGAPDTSPQAALEPLADRAFERAMALARGGRGKRGTDYAR